MREVFRGTGILLHVPALMALLSVPVAWWSGYLWGIWSLLLTAVVALTLGQILLFFGRGAQTFHRYQSMQIAAISWTLIALIGAIPFWLGGQWTPAHAIFESVSGFTSTGLTIVAAASELPAYLQWWRSLMQWVGGIGVILLLIAVLPAERGALNLYFSEAREEKILPTVKATVRMIWLIYIGYTAAGILLLWLVGEPAWRALNHGMTAIATGGFTITDDSLASAPAVVQIAYLPLMIFGAISFLVHYRLLVERQTPKQVWRLDEIRIFVGVLVFGAVLLVGQHWLVGRSEETLSLVFMWVSAVTTAGFATEPLALWSDAALLLLLVAVLMGGMAGSTGGGIKLVRVGILLKDLAGQVRELRASAHEVVMVPHNGKRITPNEMGELGRIAARLVGVFLLLWLLGVFVILHFLPAETPLSFVFFETASALFNSGLSSGLVGPDLPMPAVLVMSVLMLLGRLEVFPLLVLFAWAFGGRLLRRR